MLSHSDFAQPVSTGTPPDWGFAPALTVEGVRKAFDNAGDYTIGIEEELMLIDPETLELAPVIEAVMPLLDDDPRFSRELRQAQIELITPTCATASAASDALIRARSDLITELEGFYLVAGSGTHPFSNNWGEISSQDRYVPIADEYVWAARRSLACGLHVHVAPGDADRTLAVYNSLRSYIPELIAISANSPFVDGSDSGMASSRQKLNEAFPRAGIPPVFASWSDFVEFVEWGRVGGLFPDPSHWWWNLRLAPKHGTIEFRAADTQISAEDSGAIAALIHCLISWLGERYDAGETLPVHDSIRINENHWRAARHGLRGWIVDLDQGFPVPVQRQLSALLETLEPVAARNGCQTELAHCATLVAGNGAERQRYIASQQGVVELTRWLAEAADPGECPLLEPVPEDPELAALLAQRLRDKRNATPLNTL